MFSDNVNCTWIPSLIKNEKRVSVIVGVVLLKTNGSWPIDGRTINNEELGIAAFGVCSTDVGVIHCHTAIVINHKGAMAVVSTKFLWRKAVNDDSLRATSNGYKTTNSKQGRELRV